MSIRATPCLKPVLHSPIVLRRKARRGWILPIALSLLTAAGFVAYFFSSNEGTFFLSSPLGRRPGRSVLDRPFRLKKSNAMLITTIGDTSLQRDYEFSDCLRQGATLLAKTVAATTATQTVAAASATQSVPIYTKEAARCGNGEAD